MRTQPRNAPDAWARHVYGLGQVNARIAPQHRRRRVAHHRAFALRRRGEDGRHGAHPGRRRLPGEAVDAAVYHHQPPAANASVDHVSRYPGRQQLRPRGHAVLPGGNPRDEDVVAVHAWTMQPRPGR
jgi:hypothetical protein